MEAWLGGQAAAGGLTDVLTGAVNPSGRLAETIPLRLEDNSSYFNFPGDSQVVRYGEGHLHRLPGLRQSRQDVAFPFGFGLSYTTFALSDLKVTTRGSVADGTLAATVTVTIANTGEVDGAEVVQVYVQDVASSVSRPVRELKGFSKVSLAAGLLPAGIDRAGPAGLRLLVDPPPPVGCRGRRVRDRGRPPLP